MDATDAELFARRKHLRTLSWILFQSENLSWPKLIFEAQNSKFTYLWSICGCFVDITTPHNPKILSKISKNPYSCSVSLVTAKRTVQVYWGIHFVEGSNCFYVMVIKSEGCKASRCSYDVPKSLKGFSFSWELSIGWKNKLEFLTSPSNFP